MERCGATEAGADNEPNDKNTEALQIEGQGIAFALHLRSAFDVLLPVGISCLRKGDQAFPGSRPARSSYTYHLDST